MLVRGFTSGGIILRVRVDIEKVIIIIQAIDNSDFTGLKNK